MELFFVISSVGLEDLGSSQCGLLISRVKCEAKRNLRLRNRSIDSQKSIYTSDDAAVLVVRLR